jgi:gas vesicle protein
MLYYLLLGLALVAGVVVYLIKKGKIKDSDGDFIPDAVEEKVEEVKAKATLKAKQIKKEVKDHLGEIKEDLGEIIEEATSKPASKRRGRKPAGKRSGGSGKRVENKPTPTQKKADDDTLKVK